MKKSILNLKGAQELSKNEQKSVHGGLRHTADDYTPPVICGNIQWCQHQYNDNGIITGITVTNTEPEATEGIGINHAYPCGWSMIHPAPAGC